MIYVALAEAFAIVVLAIALYRVVTGAQRAALELERSHREERFELHERIRAPEHKPRPAAITRKPRGEDDRPPSDLTAMAQIGTVTPIRDAERGSED